jgi:L-lysine 4-chlorinase
MTPEADRETWSEVGIDGATFDHIDPQLLRDWSQRLRRFGIVTVTELVPAEVRHSVRVEAERLLDEFAERRDLRLATTDYTPRSMSVIQSETIASKSSLITSLYHDSGLTRALEAIAGERMFPCPQPDEEFLITRHEKAGDTHGWHWGDFSFALIWVLLAPPLEHGGLLQCVPHTDWDKSSPNILHYLCKNPINTYYFESGDVYFIRTDTTLHRTLPLQVDTTRIMLNMTFAAAKELERGVTPDDRWWDDAEVAKASPLAQ